VKKNKVSACIRVAIIEHDPLRIAFGVPQKHLLIWFTKLDRTTVSCSSNCFSPL